jgi:pSer/pThr/pTyr-binding forkhead associated (FHA) protein
MSPPNPINTGTFFWTRVGRGEQEVESFQGQVLRIGRGTNAGLRFTERSIDLEHAAIFFEEGDYLLRDLRSSTGVWLNGEKVRSARLRDQDTIELGGFRLKVRWQERIDPLFLQVEPLAVDPELSTVIHTFKASNQALQVLAELEAQRLARDPFAEPSEMSTYIGRVLPGLELAAGDTQLLTRHLTTLRPRQPPKPPAEGFTELLSIQREPKAPPPAAGGRSAPLVPQSGPLGPPPLGPPPLGAPLGPPPGSPRGPSPAGGPSFAASVAPPPAMPPKPARPAAAGGAAGAIDYGRSYLLPAVQAKVGVTLAAFLATALFFFQLFAAQGGAMFAPGPLASPHRSTIKACGECHSGFRPVADLSCRSSCHIGIGDHQGEGAARQAGKLACTDCHTEHHGDQSLALVSKNVCVSCHGGLAERLPDSVFANRVSDFAGDHPEFAIDTPDGRRRLSEPDGRQADPGGLVNFNHLWHLTKLPARSLQTCGDCHRRDAKTDEILPLDFEVSCRQCHSLRFDNRFGDLQAPHEEPRKVFDFITGAYLRGSGIRVRPDDGSRVVASASLVYEQQATQLAQVTGERMLRNVCAKCHRFESAGGRGDEAKVAPVVWRAPYFVHSRFEHGPHVRLAECKDCHALAERSEKSQDLLLPGIASCQTCHRDAASAKVDKSRIGESHCLNCHSYHPTPAELAASRAHP